MYRQRNPTITLFDTTPDMSETEVNTERVVVKNASMRHTEGGWPKDVDFTEQSDVSRFRKKAEKDEEYQQCIKALGPLVERCMKQNSTVNIYEKYFEGEQTDHRSEPPNAKGLAVFRDPSEVKRTATSIDWHPEGASNGRIAVSYSILNFQDARFEHSKMSSSVCDVVRNSHSFYTSKRNIYVHTNIPINLHVAVLHMGHNKLKHS